MHSWWRVSVQFAGWVLLVVSACASGEAPAVKASNADPTPPKQAEKNSAPAPAPASPLAAFDGKCVRLEGFAAGAKIGAQLRGGNGAIWVAPAAGDDAWSNLPLAARVEVQGTVQQRSDLPVFIPKPDEPMMAGIPVPEGTDLESARRRWVVDKAHYRVLRTKDEILATLATLVGDGAQLTGVVRKQSGWTLSDTGVEVALTGVDRLSGFDFKLHGEAVQAAGTLSKRPNGSFELAVASFEATPPWKVDACR